MVSTRTSPIEAARCPREVFVRECCACACASASAPRTREEAPARSERVGKPCHDYLQRAKGGPKNRAARGGACGRGRAACLVLK